MEHTQSAFDRPSVSPSSYAGSAFALNPTRCFDGRQFHHDTAVVIDQGKVQELVPAGSLDPKLPRTDLDGLLAPGFVDLQVNGGGGVQFNGNTTPQALHILAEAHLHRGTTSLFPTLTTDDPKRMEDAITAVGRCMNTADPCYHASVRGIHLEGPYISPNFSGAHPKHWIRRPADSDIRQLCACPVRPMIITLAPEVVTPETIAELTTASIIVSLGHSGCTSEQAARASAAGARAVTHLFNAMAPLHHRSPGLAGAALSSPDLACSLICDGHHVNPAVIGLALRGKRGHDTLFLISDSMAPLGTSEQRFTMGDQIATRRNGRLELPDGTLAGADICMADAVRLLVTVCDTPPGTSLRMATSVPANLVDQGDRCGMIAQGFRADFVELDDDFRVRSVWQSGNAIQQLPGPPTHATR